MKRKELTDLKEKNISELKKKIADLEKETTNEQIELKMGKVKNVHALKNKKKDIAKLKTIIRMKEVIKVTKEPKVTRNKKTYGSSGSSDNSVISQTKEQINATS